MAARMMWYQDEEGLAFEGYFIAPADGRERPGVLVAPAWLNVDDSIRRRADRLAELGYAVLVADLFGAGIRPTPPQLPLAVAAPLLGDRLLFRRRLFAALRALQSRSECRANQIAAVGYCLGGCGVLELARAGAAIRGVVSLHGLLNAPIPAQPDSIRAKVLVLHGDADPIVPFEQVAAFREEMVMAGVNWEIDVFGGARHSFTGEGVVDRASPEAGLHAQSELRSWYTTVRFLDEVLR